MDAIELPVKEEKRTDGHPYCPACNGPLLLLRGFYRCVRCCYSMCEGCEPDCLDED